ncbi:hypothetical protein ACP4OV_028079 [Aristida adscensionis]
MSPSLKRRIAPNPRPVCGGGASRMSRWPSEDWSSQDSSICRSAAPPPPRPSATSSTRASSSGDPTTPEVVMPRVESDVPFALGKLNLSIAE